MNKCSRCGESVWESDRYCAVCGKINEHYNEAAFQLDFNKSLDQVYAEECNKGHPEAMRDVKEDPDICKEFPFCRDCGQKLVPTFP